MFSNSLNILRFETGLLSKQTLQRREIFGNKKI